MGGSFRHAHPEAIGPPVADAAPAGLLPLHHIRRRSPCLSSVSPSALAYDGPGEDSACPLAGRNGAAMTGPAANSERIDHRTRQRLLARRGLVDDLLGHAARFTLIEVQTVTYCSSVVTRPG